VAEEKPGERKRQREEKHAGVSSMKGTCWQKRKIGAPRGHTGQSHHCQKESTARRPLEHWITGLGALDHLIRSNHRTTHYETGYERGKVARIDRVETYTCSETSLEGQRRRLDRCIRVCKKIIICIVANMSTGERKEDVEADPITAHAEALERNS